jgi:carbamoylphosphate synthase small subunit
MYQVWSKPLKDVDSRVLTKVLRKDGMMVALLYPFATSLARG